MGKESTPRSTSSNFLYGRNSRYIRHRHPIARAERLLTLALQMEQMIQEGIIKNYSDLAQRGRVSAARITQVMNLLHLAPDIQEEIQDY